MLESWSPRARRLLSSFGYTSLIAFVAALGYIAFLAESEERDHAPHADDTAEHAAVPLIEIDGYLPRQEKSTDMERLNVSVRLRLNAPGTMDSWVVVVARNDHVTPKLWAVWPKDATAAITAGGHFRGNSPGAGYQATLSSAWTRINASLDHPPGSAPFDTVMIYVANAKGEIVLVRPFSA